MKFLSMKIAMSLRMIAFVFAALLGAGLNVSPARAEPVTRYVATNGADNLGSTCHDPTHPCQSIFFALTASVSGDTIICLSPSPAHSLIIDISLTIDCSAARVGLAGGGYTQAPDGSQVRILINAPGGTVHLRGLDVEAAGGDRGIDVQSAAAVYIEDLLITNGAKQGILDHRTGGQTKLFVKNTEVSGFAGAGIVAASAAVGITVLDNVRSEKNAYGIAVGNGNNVVITNSIFSGNSVAGVEGDAGSHVVVRNSTISHNNIGVQSALSVRVYNNGISFNNTAFSGPAATLGLNSYDSNGSIGTTPGVVPGAPNDIGP